MKIYLTMLGYVPQHISQPEDTMSKESASTTRKDEAAYDAFLRTKITIARESVRAGRGRSDKDVAADFAARRQQSRMTNESPLDT